MTRLRWLALFAVAWLLAGTALVRWDIAQRRDAFQAEARTAHRLLSQRAAELEAVLATLVLLAPQADAEARLPALVPQVLRVQRGGDAAAVALSRSRGQAVVAGFDPALRQFTLLQAAGPEAVALVVGMDHWLPRVDWPYAAAGKVAVRLVLGEQALVLSPGAPALGATPGFRFAKTLGPRSQPFELQVQRATGPADWPWAPLAALAAALGAATALAATLHRQRGARRRAEELLRLDRVARLNTLGEMAAGLAHELNQPLTAVLSGAQAARRMLDDDAPAPLVEALDLTATQARRAADVVARLRKRLEQPEAAPPLQPQDLRTVAQQALALLQPEFSAAGINVRLLGPACIVLAEPVALTQIMHNLLRNALQAMAEVPPPRKRLDVALARGASHGVLVVRDHGTGLAPEVLARLFQPFTSTKTGGLGLGLSLSESLAVAMGGRLSAQNLRPHGAEFALSLPLATPHDQPADPDR
ncbi:Histidine kinase [Rubrivivax sp. A210]|uniref:sensor histidine kinase n=1 Tax=Rubrivivax sp. A210 TaxID=2772301 RepID=UPI00191A5C77|nr:ATP-binding protein [Rubrivivax sp. A210]CAD5371329.1 Histidine kinase [Rubrivivax sp. A210]